MCDGEIGVSSRNGKRCTNCAMKIKKGDFFFRIQEKSTGEGSRHLCHHCTHFMVRAVEEEVKIRGIQSYTAESNRRSCASCKKRIHKGEKVARIQTRFKTVREDYSFGSDRHQSYCDSCLDEIKQVEDAYIKGIQAYDAPKYINSKYEYVRKKAMEALDGRRKAR
jgi:phage terminase large subunit GpA-like protein